MVFVLAVSQTLKIAQLYSNEYLMVTHSLVLKSILQMYFSRSSLIFLKSVIFVISWKLILFYKNILVSKASIFSLATGIEKLFK